MIKIEQTIVVTQHIADILERTNTLTFTLP